MLRIAFTIALATLLVAVVATESRAWGGRSRVRRAALKLALAGAVAVGAYNGYHEYLSPKPLDSKTVTDACKVVTAMGEEPYYRALMESAKRWKVKPELILAIQRHESTFETDARGEGWWFNRAMGAAQVKPDTLTDYKKAVGGFNGWRADPDNKYTALDITAWHVWNTARTTALHKIKPLEKISAKRKARRTAKREALAQQLRNNVRLSARMYHGGAGAIKSSRYKGYEKKVIATAATYRGQLNGSCGKRLKEEARPWLEKLGDLLTW